MKMEVSNNELAHSATKPNIRDRFPQGAFSPSGVDAIVSSDAILSIGRPSYHQSPLSMQSKKIQAVDTMDDAHMGTFSPTCSEFSQLPPTIKNTSDQGEMKSSSESDSLGHFPRVDDRLILRGSIDTQETTDSKAFYQHEDAAYVSQSSLRSLDLLQRAHKVLGKAALTLRSTKNDKDRESQGPIRSTELSNLLRLAESPGPLVFTSSEESGDEITASARKASFSSTPASNTLQAVETKEGAHNLFSKEVASDGTNTRRTDSFLEHDFSFSNVYMHTPYKGPNDHYPDPDLIFSISSKESLMTQPPEFLVRDTNPWEHERTLAAIRQSRSKESNRRSSRRITRSPSGTTMHCSTHSWESPEGDIPRHGKMRTSPTDRVPSVGRGYTFTEAEHASNPSTTNRSRNCDEMATSRRGLRYRDDSINFSESLSSMSIISPASSNDSTGSGRSSKDGLFEGRGHDSMSTLSVATAVNPGRSNKSDHSHGSQGRAQKTSCLHLTPQSVDLPQMPLHERGDFLSPDDFEVTKTDFWDSQGKGDIYYSREKVRGCGPADTGMARLLPSGHQARRRLFGGPGGKYILDEEEPRPSCLAKLFTGFSPSDRVDQGYVLKRVSGRCSPQASYDETFHSYSTESARLPRAAHMFHSEYPRPRYYRESPRYCQWSPMHCPGCCKEKQNIHSTSPRGVQDFTRGNWQVEQCSVCDGCTRIGNHTHSSL